MAQTDTGSVVTAPRVVVEGWLRQKRSRLHLWDHRYFILMLDPPRLSYFSKAPTQPNQTPKTVYTLEPECIVTEVDHDGTTRKKPLFAFHIFWPNSKPQEESDDDEEEHRERSLREIAEVEANSHKKMQKRVEEQLALEEKSKSSSVTTGAKVAAVAVGGVVIGALTVVGVVPYLIAVGIAATAAGGGAVALDLRRNAQRVTLAAHTMEEAQKWRNAIDSCVCTLAGRKQKIPEHVSYKLASHVFRGEAQWSCAYVKEGMRVLEDCPPRNTPGFRLNGKGLCTRKAQVVVNATPLDAFLCLMEFSEDLLLGTYMSVNIVEQLDDHADVMCLRWKAPLNALLRKLVGGVNSMPVSTSGAWPTVVDIEACILRYWRLEEDGTYVVTLNSTEHDSCSPVARRIDLQAVYVAAPRKDRNSFINDVPESLVTCACQLSGFSSLHVLLGIDQALTDGYLGQIANTRSILMEQRYTSHPARSTHAEPSAEGVVTTQPTNLNGSATSESPESSSEHSRSGTSGQQKRFLKPAIKRHNLAAFEAKMPESKPRSHKHLRLDPRKHVECTVLREKMVMKEGEIASLEKMIRREGRKPQVNQIRKTDSTQELLLKLQEQLQKLDELKRTYRELTGQPFEEERTEKTCLGASSKLKAVVRAGFRGTIPTPPSGLAKLYSPKELAERQKSRSDESPPQLPGKWKRSEMGVKVELRYAWTRVKAAFIVTVGFCFSLLLSLQLSIRLGG